jgi:hypothetical protein
MHIKQNDKYNNQPEIHSNVKGMMIKGFIYKDINRRFNAFLILTKIEN